MSPSGRLRHNSLLPSPCQFLRRDHSALELKHFSLLNQSCTQNVTVELNTEEIKEKQGGTPAPSQVYFSGYPLPFHSSLQMLTDDPEARKPLDWVERTHGLIGLEPAEEVWGPPSLMLFQPP